MKQSKVTGAYIFKQMSALEEEMREISSGLDSIESDFSTSHTAYKVLSERYNEKRAAFQKLERAEYIVAPMNVNDLMNELLPE